MPQLTVKVKGRGEMLINLRYKNVTHICFSCGRIGHGAPNCKEDLNEEHGVRFGEELRASPPKRIRDINAKPVASRVIRLLFQVLGMLGENRSGPSSGRKGGVLARVTPCVMPALITIIRGLIKY
jgi:hypothetical protein